MNIKLKKLLNLTEQAPQPPQPAPVPAPSQPGGPETDNPEDAALSAPTGADAAPSPEDPSEYDFTKDFRAFEDAKNKAEAASKKKLLDRMNEKLLGKKIVANASRGYGQPKTDYTVEKVKKISVEFWYKDWVVIVTDENDKKFFLTPGVNIKIEQAGPSAEQPAQSQAPAEPQGQAPAPNAPPVEPESSPEVPNGGAPTEPQSAPTTPAPESPAAPAPQPVSGEAPQQPGQEPAPDSQPALPPKKKKKPAPVAEVVGKVLNEFITKPFDVKEGMNEIPSKNFKQQFDTRDFMLEVKGEFRSRKLQGSVDIQKIGLNYQITVQ
jgi:hypothetical protein